MPGVRKRGRSKENQEKDKKVLGYFKRGGHGTAPALAERFDFDSAQTFRMYTYILRKVYAAPIFSHHGEYGWHSNPDILLSACIKWHKRGFGYILRGGNLTYELYLIEAEKRIAQLDPSDEREALQEQVQLARVYLGNAQLVVRDINRRLGAPVVLETGAVQLPLLETAAV